MRKIRAHNNLTLTRAFPRVFVSFVLLLALNCISPTPSSALIGIKEGDRAISFTLNDVNGSAVNIAESFGKNPVVLVFWELAMSDSFLDYSMDELRFLNEMYGSRYEHSALDIFAVYTPEEAGEVSEAEIERVKKLITIHKIQFPVLIDSGFKKFREYGVIALPSTIMINIKGEIQFIYPSFPLAAQPLFKKEIDRLVGLPGESEKEEATSKETGSHSVRLYNYSVQMYKKGLLEQAVSPLKKSIEMAPDYCNARNLMGAILWKKGNFEEAREEFSRAIEIDPESLQAYFNYAVLMYESEDYRGAEGYLKKVIDLDSTVAEAHYLLGLLYMKDKRDAQAVSELDAALRMFEEHGTGDGYEIQSPAAYHRISTLYTLSGLYSRKGDREKALSLLQRAAEIALGQGHEKDTTHPHRGIDVMINE